ncbi:MAG: protocatechuate 3,4-dioxygenase subunit alpha [Vicinamibacterales bacterium]
MAGLTPSQTVGPFFDFGLEIAGGELVASPAAEGLHIVVQGSLRDGAGDPVPDAVIEVWQANAAGRFRHPADDRPVPLDEACDGFGRVATTTEGRFTFRTVMPGRVPAADPRQWQAPHLLISVLARGLLTRLATRMYFADAAANDEDPVLALVPPERRATLMARRVDPTTFAFDIVLQGPGETVFFDV